MIKLQHVIGLPVLETETGIQIGEVGEVLLDIEAAMICGLVLNPDKDCVRVGGIAFEDIVSLGRDAIIIRSCGMIRQLEMLFSVHQIYSFKDLCDKQLFTDSGLCLGRLADVVFDSVTGEMKYYQVSDSIITDLLYGRLLMPLPYAQMIGDDKIIVPDAMCKLLYAAEIEM